ncbi:hypothetical protein [Bradyrhizobium sp. USDA 4454]
MDLCTLVNRSAAHAPDEFAIRLEGQTPSHASLNRRIGRAACRLGARIEAEALMALVRSRLARFKVPSEVIFTHGKGSAFCAEGSRQAIKWQARRQLSSADEDQPCFPATLPMMP